MSIPIDHNFQTPPHVCSYMADMIPECATAVLEPTPGQGNLRSAIEKRGFHVPDVDDYFLLDKSQRYDCICMNPPFSSKSAFLDNAPEIMHKSGMKIGYHILFECLNMSDHVIALMPWFTISDSDVRLRSLKKYGMISVTALPRNTLQYARIQTVILEMKRGFSGTTSFKTLEQELNIQENIDLINQ